ncbi:2-succinyl-6-hydroxy-2,4-cyclohexadiene-1-carboxylate synthase [Bacillus sp. FJAT-29790]|uniref:2-succinyl-6-hydroxy-2, 4-cyclohexadiene-1-carboxylate synthase n=1 Tax=Bacillus sp. FJAT-29790 TaxID=1895002 RepID=UPI001C230C19|nr:2-succinyl-6-hydroxy-2,4-cyclohexadiene-1-carboxylate synthase [Bacillus sp. FJAT-29790]MBU8879862.1 2-succinyl-6-hydroxy-2,4-cyclohexadiene-1-carboxylate synthase [Bacillus sp. FJAT-29790]
MNFDIDGIRYHVDKWSSQSLDSPLLLLHGFTGDSAAWREFEPQWKRHSNTITVDIIGHGKTDSPLDESRYDIESMASDLHKLLKEMGIEQTDLLGYSMGGRLAITFALKFPKMVRKLILESSSPGLETEREREARRIQDEQLAWRIQEYGVNGFVEYWENIPLFQSQKRLPENLRKKIRMQRLNNSQVGLINSLKGMGTGSQPSFWEELDQLNIPTLLITGSLDEKFCRIADKMIEKLKKGEWVSITDCGHAIHVENPEIFGTIVSEFLSNDDGENFKIRQ